MSGDFLDTSRPVLEWVLRTTWEASLIAAMVLLAQYLLRGRVSARWRYNLWLLVVARLLLPAVPGTQYSPFNLVQLPQPPRAPAAQHAVPLVRPRLVPTPPARVIPVPGPAQEPPRRQPIYLASTAAAPYMAAAEVEPAGAANAMEPQFPGATPDPIATGIREARPLATLRRPLPPPSLASQFAAPATIPRPAPAPVVPWHRRVNWVALAAVVWIAGAAFAAARLAWVSLRLAAAVRCLRPLSDPELAQLLHECAAQLRLRRIPSVLEAPDGFGPALVGLIRPRVVLPACVLRGPFKRDELRLVLMHELAHMKRWDVAANWLLAVLGVVHWFNPVLRLTFRRMRLDRELACDELVLSATAPTVARAYGPTLLKLLQTLSRRPALPGMVGVLEGKPSIRRRIAMIARFDRSNRNSSPLFGVALSVLAGGVALTGAVRGQQSPPEPAPPGEVRELSADLTRDDDDASRERAEAEREARDQQREAAREAEDQARQAAREAEDQARESAREAEDQARESARESEDHARQSRRESLESAREAMDAARERASESQQALAERRQAAQERAKEAEESIAEARREFEQRQSETQNEIDESRKAMAEAQQQAANHEQDLRRQLEDAKQSLADHQAKQPAEGDDDAAREAADRLQELTGAVEEKERELADAASEREQALRDANAELERAAGERENTLQEVRAELERANGELQEAMAEAAREVDQAGRELEGAVAELAVARDALTRAETAERAAPAEPLPAPELPPLPDEPSGIEPVPAEPPPAPDAPPVEPPIGIGPVVSVSVTPAPTPDAAPSAETPAVGAAAPTPVEPAPAVSAAPAALPPTPTSAAGMPPAVSAGGPAVAAAQPSLTPAPPRAGAANRAATPYGAMGGYGGYPGYPAPGTYPGYGRGGSGLAQPVPGGMPGGYPGMMGMPGAARAPAADGAPAGRIENPAARDADRRTSEALRRALPVNFENVPFEEVLRFVADAAKVDVIADWKGLEAAGIDRSAPVSLTLRQGAPAEQVLTWVLRAAGGDVLGFAVDHGVVVVAPQERIDRMVITRAYPLGGLADSGQALESLVRDTVAPNSWRENGGSGAVRFFNNQLFVTATEPNHRQVERLLGLMEAQNVHKPASGAVPGMGMYPGMGGMPGGAPTAAPARR